MSSAPDPLPPLGIAAHLPPGALIAIAWVSVGLAGAFGRYCLERLRPVSEESLSCKSGSRIKRPLVPVRADYATCMFAPGKQY